MKLRVKSFDIIPAPCGSLILGPAVIGPNGERLGQAVIVVDENTAKEITEALAEESQE